MMSNRSSPLRAGAAQQRAIAVALNAKVSGADPACGAGIAIAMNGDGSDVPEWIELIPAGPDIVGRDGRRWRMADPAQIVRAFAANRADLPIDWEHAQFLAATQGKPAPAAGWIKSVEARNGALWGRVEWTDRGRETIARREYRYVSPVFTFDAATKDITALKCVGLVNRPNLVTTALNQEGATAVWKKVLAALGLPETATEDDAVTAIKAMGAEKDVALNAAKNPPNNLFVPRADYDAAINREVNAKEALAAHIEKARKTEAEAVVEKAIAEGRITPAAKDYHVAACHTEDGLAAFNAMIAKVPVNPAAKPSGLDGQKPAEGTALNAEEIAVCTMLGYSEAQFLEAKAKLVKA